jgi:hypothetical protein
VFRKNLRGRIVLPYIVHQTGRVDPHIPSAVPLADKLDEVLFEGLFNVSANPSGITYEDGLGELVGMDENNVVTVRLKKDQKWHTSFMTTMEKDEITVADTEAVYFEARDLKFTLDRIRKFGSLSPDYILVSQAIPTFDFSGPDENNEIHFQFKGDRIWSPDDIKEILSFKILPYNSEMAAPDYAVGTGPYLKAGDYENTRYYYRNPARPATVSKVLLKPYIDNSTYITELKNRNINSLLGTPFGEISPILRDTTDYFYKSSIATSFFCLLFNTAKLNLEQRRALRSLVDNQKVMERFFKIGTPQQRHIANYKGEGDNYEEYLNQSVFPTTSYYISEQVVVPQADTLPVDLSLLPDTVQIQTCVDFQFREELLELVEILKDPALFGGRIKATAVPNEEIAQGNYDAVLVPVSGYRSNFLFDLYSVFLREPDFATSQIHLLTQENQKGEVEVAPASFTADKNFLRLDWSADLPETDSVRVFLEHLYGFMSTNEIGDKQAYSQLADACEQQLALGKWLFSLPSLAYFGTQFENASIDLYGTASQLSTIEKWRETEK